MHRNPGIFIVACHDFRVAFQAIAMVVKDAYTTLYLNYKNFSRKYVSILPVTPDLQYEYLIASARNENAVKSMVESK